MLKHTILAALLAITVTACSKKESSPCEAVYAHTLSLLPEEFKSKVAGDKDAAIAKCEKLSPEARQCALDATSMADLMKCPKN
jgi:hypothetical protein